MYKRNWLTKNILIELINLKMSETRHWPNPILYSYIIWKGSSTPYIKNRYDQSIKKGKLIKKE